MTWQIRCVGVVAFAFWFPNSSLLAQMPQSSKPDCNEALTKKWNSTHQGAAALLVKPTDRSPHYQIATIQFRQDNVAAHYALYVRKTVLAYEGNDLAAMVRRLNDRSPLPNGGSYYVAFDGFEPHRAENMVNSMRLQLDSVDSTISVEPIAGKVEEWTGVMLQRVVEVVGQPEIRQLPDGWFEGSQGIVLDRLRQATLRVKAKSRLLIQNFFDLFRDKVATAKSPRTAAEIVSNTRAEIKQKLSLNDAEFRAVVFDQTGKSYTVELFVLRYAG
jgi:hypothetical protein